MATVTMPQLGETVVEGTITKWLKGPGDQVERDEPLFEISTDKVDTEVPSPVAGTLKDILVQEGETVKVGTDLATIDEDGGGEAAAEERAGEPEEAPGQKAESEAAEQGEKAAAEEEKVAEAEQPQPEPAQPSERRATPQRQETPTRPEPAPSREEERRPVSAPAGRGPRSHILSPLVRRLADENNIDLSQVEGTGTGGRITKKDITSFIESGGAQRPALRAVPEAGAAPARAAQQIPAGEAEQTVKISH